MADGRFRVPPELNWVVNILVGNQFPNGSPSGMRKYADVYSSLDASLVKVKALLAQAFVSVRAAGQSDGLTQALGFLRQIDASLDSGPGVEGVKDGTMFADFAAQDRLIHDDSYRVAGDVEYAQVQLVIMAIMLAGQLSWMLLWSALTGEAIFAAQAAWVSRLAQMSAAQLLKMLALAVAKGAGMMLLVDALTQGTRKWVLKTESGWDTTKTWQAAGVGALNGLLDGLLNLGHAGLGKGPASLRPLDKALSDHAFVTAAVKGGLGAGLTQVAWDQIQIAMSGQASGPRSVAGAFTSGAFMGVVGLRTEQLRERGAAAL